MSTEDTPQIPVDAPAPDARVDAIAAPPAEPQPSEAFAAPTGDAPAADDFVAQHPEALVAGAFAGAFVFAKILKRISGG